MPADLNHGRVKRSGFYKGVILLTVPDTFNLDTFNLTKILEASRAAARIVSGSLRSLA
jgi:hypothetical protein